MVFFGITARGALFGGLVLVAFVGCDRTSVQAGREGVPPPGPKPSAAARAQPPAKRPCRQGEDPFLVVLERAVAPGASFRVVAVSEQALGGARLVSERRPLAMVHRLRAGPPYALQWKGVAPAIQGDHPIRLLNRSGDQVACTSLEVRSRRAILPRRAPTTGIWPIRRSWSNAWERVFSAWIAYLFRPLPGQPAGWRPLHQVLRKPVRNFLHNRLGLDEDDRRAPTRVVAIADCGDTPYQLRAYFAWKFHLPFRFRRCSRGSSLRGPRCPVVGDNTTARFDGRAHPVRRFNAFIRQGLAWLVHSGTTRTLPEDEASDFYPVALTRQSIRPGTISVDVAGHVFVVTQWDRDGLYAIDGHPDWSVTRRRFSPKHFHYHRGTRTGGFKAFRPLRLQHGKIVPLPNRALERFFSTEQYRFTSSRAFHRRMDRLIATHAG